MQRNIQNSTESPAEKKVKILIVEDDFLIAENLVSKLIKLGYDVTDSVASGEEALEVLQSQKPDLLLVDIGLAGKMDGVRTVEEIAKTVQIPTIYLTGRTDTVSLARAKKTTPSAYIIKPFNDRDLNIAIELAFHNASQNQPGISEDNEQDIRDLPTKGPFILKDRFFVKDDGHYQKVELNDILWVEANRAYSEMVSPQRKFLLSVSLNVVEQKLVHERFIRVHRSFIINIQKVDAFDGQSVMIHKRSIPVSKTYRQEFLKRFQFL